MKTKNAKEVQFNEILSATTFLPSLTTASPARGLFDDVLMPCQRLPFLERHFQHSCAVYPEGPSCLACPSLNTSELFSWLPLLSWYKLQCFQRTNLSRHVYSQLFVLTNTHKGQVVLPHPRLFPLSSSAHIESAQRWQLEKVCHFSLPCSCRLEQMSQWVFPGPRAQCMSWGFEGSPGWHLSTAPHFSLSPWSDLHKGKEGFRSVTAQSQITT